MRKVVLGMSALALVAAAAWAGDNEQSKKTKTAAVDTSTAAFTKLDEDSDGRVSAIEAANETEVAANFTQADQNGDGYLSREEFMAMGSASEYEQSGQPSSPDTEMGSEPQQ